MSQNDMLINVKVNLTSNAPAFLRDIQAQFGQLLSAANAPTTARGATGEVAKAEGQSLAQLQKIQKAGLLSRDEFAAAHASVRQASEEHRRNLSQQLGQEVRAPSQSEILRSAGAAYRQLAPGISQTEQNKAVTAMRGALKKQVEAETTKAESATAAAETVVSANTAQATAAKAAKERSKAAEAKGLAAFRKSDPLARYQSEFERASTPENAPENELGLRAAVSQRKAAAAAAVRAAKQEQARADKEFEQFRKSEEAQGKGLNKYASRYDAGMAKAKAATAREEEKRRKAEEAEQERLANEAPGRLSARGLAGAFGNKLATTASYALSAGALYGGISLGKNIIKEADELQVQLALVKVSFEETDAASRGITFDQYRDALRDISKESGVAVSKVAAVTRQLAGTFADKKTGDPNFVKATKEGDVAVRFAKLTGLPEKEIANSLGAIALAYDTTFTHIADVTSYLSRHFGVAETDIVEFTAGLAPLGKELGFTVEQLAALGAVAQQGSSLSGQALLGQFSKILPALQTKRTEILTLLNQSPGTASFVAPTAKAFETGDMKEVLSQLLQATPKLTKTQEQLLATIVGTRKEASAFYNLANRGQAALKALKTDPNVGAGEFETRWKTFADTINISMSKARKVIEDFGIALFQSGIDTGLESLIRVMGGVGDAAEMLLSLFGGLSDLTGGLSGKLIVAAGAFYLFQKAAKVAGFGAAQAAVATEAETLATSMSAAANEAQLLASAAVENALRRKALAASQAAVAVGEEGSAAGLAAVADANAAFAADAYANSLVVQAEASELAAAAARQQALSTQASMLASLRAAAPLIALVVAYEAINLIKQKGEQQDSASKAAKSYFTDRLDSGVSFEDLRKKVLEEVPEETGWRKHAPAYFSEQKQTLQALQDAKAAQQQPINQAFLSNVFDLSKSKDKDEKAMWEKFVGEAHDIDYDDGALGGEKLWASQGEKYRKKYTKKFRDNLEKFLKEPEKYVKELEALRARAANDPEFAQILNEAQGMFDEEPDLDPHPRDDLSSAVATAEEARAKYGLGQIGFAMLLRSLAKQSADALIVLQGEHESDPEYAKDAAAFRDSQKAIADAYKADIDAKYALRTNIEGIGAGEADPQQAFRDAAQKFTDIANSPESSTDKAAGAFALIKARDAAYKDAIKHAGSDAEVAKLLKEGPPPLDPAATRAITRNQFDTGLASSYADQVAVALGITTDQAKDMLTDMYIKFGDGAVVQINAMIEAQRAVHQEARRQKKRIGQHLDPGEQAEWNKSQDAQDLQFAATEAIGAAALGQITDIDDNSPEAIKTRTEDARKAAMARLAATYNLKKSGHHSAVEKAQLVLDELRQQVPDPDDPNAPTNLLAQIADAKESLDNAVLAEAKGLSAAQLDLERARAHGDPVKLALINIKAANRAKGFARTGTPEERVAADAQGETAAEEYRKAQDDIAVARQQYVAAQQTAAGNDVAAAYVGMQIANAEIAASADNTVARYTALSHQLSASKTFREALMNVFAAQQDLAAALYEASGDTASVLRTQLDTAANRYNLLLQAGVTGPELDAAHAGVIRAQTAVTEGARAKRLGDLAYLYEFDKITISGYIAKLQQELQSIPESQVDARREIERQIKQLRDEVGKDLAFNLPSDLKIPTLYESRRLGQSAGGGYQDNRVVTITLNANNAVDGKAAVQSIVDAINGPARIGIAPRSY